MVVREYKLYELGFRKKVYENQEGRPVFWRKDESGYIVEIADDYSIGQWSDSASGSLVEGSDFDFYQLDNDWQCKVFCKKVMSLIGIDIEE